MIVKFPNTWISSFEKTPFDEDGKLTPGACEWSSQLSTLTPTEIKKGIDNLLNREEKRFPPNAMEFKDLCLGNEYENALNAIICRLQIGQVYEWTDQTAFNIWMDNSHRFLQLHEKAVPKMVKLCLIGLDRDKLNPLPDYTINQITEQENYISYSDWLKTQSK